MSPVRDAEVPVLIVGGSLVGLSTALFLADLGVEPLVVERHPGTAIHPRAAFFLQRTVELWRAVGLQDEIFDASSLEFEQNGAIVSVETLGGKEVATFYQHINEGVEHLSPSPRLFVTQIGLEPLLRRRAQELGAKMRYSTDCVSVEQDADGVTARIRDRDSGEESAVRAQYLVGADGVRSATRERLGIAMLGHPSFSNSITIYFKGDVNPLLRGRNLSVIYVFGPRLQGFFRFSLAGDAGFLVVNKALVDGELSADIWGDTSEERCVEYVREALGDPEIRVEIENVQRWNASAEWAERFREGRIFLAGDSAHVMPPTGGYGGNTGVHDASNLAWKLAHVLQGKAGPALLDTYDPERRPVAERTVEQAYSRYVLRLAPELGTEGLHEMVDDALIDLGYRYESAAVVSADADGKPYASPHEPAAAPGVRIPHVELEDGRSTIDLVGRELVLLTGDEGWRRAAEDAALRAHVVRAPGFAEVYGPGAVLVRPDGFAAWRSDGAPDGDALGAAVRQVLAL
jgi:2-polyprenyl-6-methoxyphenol hydroxylase-like FAD-dependent oxidoreductase